MKNMQGINQSFDMESLIEVEDQEKSTTVGDFSVGKDRRESIDYCVI